MSELQKAEVSRKRQEWQDERVRQLQQEEEQRRRREEERKALSARLEQEEREQPVSTWAALQTSGAAS